MKANKISEEDRGHLIAKMLQKEAQEYSLSEKQLTDIRLAMRKARRERSLGQRWMDWMEYEVEIDLMGWWKRKDEAKRVVSLFPVTLVLCLMILSLCFPYEMFWQNSNTIVMAGANGIVVLSERR